MHIPFLHCFKFHENFTSLNDLTFSFSCCSVLQFFIYCYTNYILLCTLTLWSLSTHMLHHVAWCSKCLATLHMCQPIMAIFLQYVAIFPDPINIGCYISAKQSGIGSCVFSMTACHSFVHFSSWNKMSQHFCYVDCQLVCIGTQGMCYLPPVVKPIVSIIWTHAYGIGHPHSPCHNSSVMYQNIYCEDYTQKKFGRGKQKLRLIAIWDSPGTLWEEFWRNYCITSSSVMQNHKTGVVHT